MYRLSTEKQWSFYFVWPTSSCESYAGVTSQCLDVPWVSWGVQGIRTCPPGASHLVGIGGLAPMKRAAPYPRADSMGEVEESVPCGPRRRDEFCDQGIVLLQYWTSSGLLRMLRLLQMELTDRVMGRQVRSWCGGPWMIRNCRVSLLGFFWKL